MKSIEKRFPELSGQSVIVTGGTRGIGRGIAHVLARAGVRLMITGRKPARLEAVAQELEEIGADFRTLQADVADAAASRKVVGETVAAFGGVDGLVANAQSYISVKPLAEIDESDFDRLLSTGPKGTLWLMQAVRPHMQARGRGRIVTFGSSMGFTGAPGYGPYSAAKEGVRSLTRTAAREWGRDGITVNCVCPASVAHRLPPGDEGVRARAFAQMYEDHPLGRDGDPEADIAPVVAFLLSDASQYMTGQTFMVDGGGMLQA
ncbi:MAG: SDR family oxidoreductase [Deltaproteobacteria bacterium]|jgi:NAD(P)-dependent dehydrogenase (short-subunit alcohol dehydrogenase family)|nr:SDR family oxidoreductase [Deltaproteobacteria bacterium]MBW2496654.1 SDR family oxidoreductase [Deltaproteobacteria bacterium]